MREVQYVPLSTAIADIYRSIDEYAVDTSNIEEWSAWAMSKMEVSVNFEERVTFIPLSNHKAILPKGLKYIWQILYKTSFTDQDVQEINVYTSCANCLTITSEVSEFFNSTYLNSNRYYPMRMATTPLIQSVLCANSPENDESLANLYQSCEYKYYINKQGILTSTLDEATLCIAYLSYPKNENDEFLIPDNKDYFEAIRYYVMFRIFEARSFTTGTQDFNRSMQYLQLFEIKAAKVRGDLQMPGIDGLENLKQSLMHIAPTPNAYYGLFGNLATSNNISF